MNAPSPRQPACLLVIPSYRDRHRLVSFATSLACTLPAAFSIQIVDDGSGPGEMEKLAEMAAAINRSVGVNSAKFLPLMQFRSNRGKGAAVRLGLSACIEYELSGFADADGSVSAEEILRGYRHVVQHWEVLDGILASRVRMLGRTVERNLGRHLCGRIFATAVAGMSRLPVYDTQCGFKLFKSAFLDRTLPQMQSERFAFDVEMILELRRCGARLQEFPVDWHHRDGSKVSVVRDMVPMLIDVWHACRRARKTASSGGRPFVPSLRS